MADAAEFLRKIRLGEDIVTTPGNDCRGRASRPVATGSCWGRPSSAADPAPRRPPELGFNPAAEADMTERREGKDARVSRDEDANHHGMA